MYTNKFLQRGVCALLLVFSYQAQAKVVVSIDNHPLIFITAPRVVEVLEKTDLSQDWYWPAAQLFSMDTTLTQPQQLKVVKQLNEIAMRLEGADKTDVVKFRDSIQSWALGQRVSLSVSYDKARFIEQNNPQLSEGNYLLVMKKRPTDYYVTGLVAGEEALTINPERCLGETLAGWRKSALASNDLVWIIQPDGKIMKYGIAYWNRDCHQVMPGSQIFFPFKDSFFSKDLQKLNRLIAELASNRIIN